MSEPQSPPMPFDHISKELARLLNELAKVNAQPYQQAEVLTGICTQIIAYQSFLSVFISGKQTEHMAKLLEHTDKLTTQTEVLIQLTERTEKLTRRLVVLTWGIIVVSLLLFIFTAVQTAVLLKEDKSGPAPQQHDGESLNPLNSNGR